MTTLTKLGKMINECEEKISGKLRKNGLMTDSDRI